MSNVDTMKSFKELLQQDVNKVFVNENEFAETHKINGNEMKIIIDDDELLEIAGDKNQEGIFKNKKLIKMSAEIWGGRKPKQGTTLNMDGKTYTVYHSMIEDGMLTVILEGVRA